MELILKEKDFREKVASFNWAQFQNITIAVFCSVDAIIPSWAYMIITSSVSGIANSIIKGNKGDVINQLWEKNITQTILIQDFIDKRVILKGCGDHPTPVNVFIKITELLRPQVKSLMYGEACSSVPVYKKQK